MSRKVTFRHCSYRYLYYLGYNLFMTKEHIEQEAIDYLKKHKQTFFAHYLQSLNPLEEKAAFFTAGPSGAGKTEFAQSLLEIDTNLLHLDIDSVREFFTPIGYDGSNSDVYQKPAGRGVQMLFDEGVKKRGLSLIIDSNLSNTKVAHQNIMSLLDRGYRVEIFYIYDELEKCFLYTKKREAITKRRVPEDVFLRSVHLSKTTTFEIKNEFDDKITLTLIDKRTDTLYDNISCHDFLNILSK